MSTRPTPTRDPTAISGFNRGDITTPFVPAPSCTEIFTLYTASKSLQLFFGHAAISYLDAACLPQGTKQPTDLANNKAEWGTYYYSPAICPYSWTSAHTFTSLFTGDASRTVVPLGPETTAVLCCPPGYVKGIWGHRCTSTVTVDQVLRYVAPRLDGTGYDRGETKETTIEQETRVIGDGVPIWWQASDLPVLEAAAQMTPTSMPPSASTSGAPSEGSAPTLPENTSASDAERNQSSSSSGGLTTGGKIGLGVGLPIAILLGLFIGYMFARRRRAKKIGGGDSAIPSEMAQHENGGVGAGKSAARYELKSDPVFEMDGGAGGKVELPASVELPAEAEADTEAGRTTRTV